MPELWLSKIFSEVASTNSNIPGKLVRIILSKTKLLEYLKTVQMFIHATWSSNNKLGLMKILFEDMCFVMHLFSSKISWNKSK